MVEVAVVELLYKVARVCGWPSKFSGLSLQLDVLRKPLVELDSKSGRPQTFPVKDVQNSIFLMQLCSAVKFAADLYLYYLS